ncbi:MAG: sialate O-acetylesterase [Bifidobacteriaceae bacterium]|jgi:hypothetical protein|nr:sialate O-acetylesterase [Bifidobacteriaceae bacterium]
MTTVTGRVAAFTKAGLAPATVTFTHTVGTKVTEEGTIRVFPVTVEADSAGNFSAVLVQDNAAGYRVTITGPVTVAGGAPAPRSVALPGVVLVNQPGTHGVSEFYLPSEPSAGPIPDWAQSVLDAYNNVAGEALPPQVEAVVDGLDVVLRSDLGAPVEGAFDDTAIAADVDGTGHASRLVFADGRQHFPKASASDLRIGPGSWQAVDNEDYVFAIVDKDDRIGFGVRRDLTLPQPTIDRIAARLPGVGGPFIVIGILGQSNATEADTASASLAFYSGGAIRAWSSQTGRGEPISDTTAWVGTGLAREIHARYPEQRVLVVPCGAGSTGFTTSSLDDPPSGHTYTENGTWDRTLAEDPKNLALAAPPKILAALAWAQSEHGDSTLGGLVWSQGEADRSMTQTAYAAALDDLLGWTRAQLDAPDTPAAVGGFEPQWARDPANNADAIQLALADTPRRVLGTAFMAGPDDLGDPSGLIHWSGEGQELRGRMLVDALIRARLNTSASEPISPQRLTVSRSGSLVEIDWEAPPCRVTAYTVEVSTDQGTTWTALTLASPLALHAETTVAASLPVWARATITNEVGTSAPTREVKR